MTQFLQSIPLPQFYALVAAVVGLLIYAWRKLSPSTWDLVTRGNPKIQQLPTLVLAGLMSAMPALDKSFWPALAQVCMGIVFGGGGAILGHEGLKAIPWIPYTGGKAPPPPLFPPDKPGVTGTSEMDTPVERPLP